MAKGHFNVLKGAYPSLTQLDKTLPVNDGVTGLVRGMVIRESSGEWVLCADDVASRGDAGTVGPVIYFALQDQDQTDVDMAGGLTGLPCTMPMEVETDQFGGTPAVGTLLVAGANSKVQAWAAGQTAIGVVTKASYRRWVNDLVVSGTSTRGSFTNVLAFQTMYAPTVNEV